MAGQAEYSSATGLVFDFRQTIALTLATCAEWRAFKLNCFRHSINHSAFAFVVTGDFR